MSIPNLHHISAIRCGKAAGAFTLGGIGQQRAATNTDVIADALNGEVSGRWVSVRSQKPVFDFMTKALKTALAEIPVTGLDIATAWSGADKLTLFGQKVAEGGSRASGSVHRSMKANKGMVVLGTLSCQHQQDAELTLTAIITYDGTNDPIVVADNVALPAVPAAGSDNERFSLGRIFLNTLELTGNRSVSINFGVQAMSEGSDSEIWDRFAYVRELMPEITISGVDVTVLQAAKIPLNGLIVTKANPAGNTGTRIFFRRRGPAAGGGGVGVGFVGDAVAEHVRVNASGLAYVETPFDGSGNQPGTATIRIKCHNDGSVSPAAQPPVVVTTDVAIA